MGLVVTAEPDWNRLPAQTRSAIQPMLQRALKKGTRQDLFHELFLRHLHVLYIEDFPGFTFTRFDGTPVIIGRDSQSVSPVVIGVTVNPSTVTAGLSFSVDFSGMNLTDQTFFDVRFRAPESSIDQEVSNWQLGTSATHTLPAGTPLGSPAYARIGTKAIIRASLLRWQRFLRLTDPIRCCHPLPSDENWEFRFGQMVRVCRGSRLELLVLKNNVIGRRVAPWRSLSSTSRANP